MSKLCGNIRAVTKGAEHSIECSAPFLMGQAMNRLEQAGVLVTKIGNGVLAGIYILVVA